MVKSGRHPRNALTAVGVRARKSPGRYADGNGLYLVVDESGAKRWMVRLVINGKRHEIGLGGVALVSLAEAREKALTHRKLARAGGEPLAEKRKSRARSLTFEVAAQKVHEEQKASWRNEKHRQQWINTLRQDAFPIIGDVPIAGIGSPEILSVLSPI